MDTTWLLDKILVVPAILIGFSVHEYAHAFVADKLGDKTPKFQGRLTMNPFAHIDVIGFFMILLAGFGWAKPVQTNPSSFKRGYRDDIKVSAAGSIANLIAAFIGAIILVVFAKYGDSALQGIPALYSIILKIIMQIISVNCMLCIFNLIPIPGLDGFHILRDLFPSTYNKVAEPLYRYQMIIFLLFIMTPLAHYIVGIPYMFLYRTLISLATSIM